MLKLQKKLKLLGVKIETTGIHDRQSVRAFIAFQRKHNLTQSGMPDIATKQLIEQLTCREKLKAFRHTIKRVA
jgi:hypothetical protein